jgi:hypothetical protein
MNLIASDAMVLSKLIHTLATFIECIGKNENSWRSVKIRL